MNPHQRCLQAKVKYWNDNVNFKTTWRKSIRIRFRIPNRTYGVLFNDFCDDLPVNIE